MYETYNEIGSCDVSDTLKEFGTNTKTLLYSDKNTKCEKFQFRRCNYLTYIQTTENDTLAYLKIPLCCFKFKHILIN